MASEWNREPTGAEMASQRKSNGSEPHHRVLLIEGDEREAARVSQALRNNGHSSEVLRVETESAFVDALDQSTAPTIIGPRVTMLNGLWAPDSASRQPRVRR